MARTRSGHLYRSGHQLQTLPQSQQNTGRQQCSSMADSEFPNFMQLPLEIRLHVWGFAIASCREPRQANVIAHTNNYFPTFSSAIFRPFGRIPYLLHTCKESRNEALKSFRPFIITKTGYFEDPPWQFAYINTVREAFHFSEFGFDGRPSWDRYRILIQLLVEQHSTRKYEGNVRRDIESFKSIRSIFVSIGIFGSAPLSVWTQFSKLEVLTVISPGTDRTSGEDVEECDNVSFLRVFKPHPSSKYGRRRTWLRDQIIHALEKVSMECSPHWRMPRIDVTIEVMRLGSFHLYEDSTLPANNSVPPCTKEPQEGDAIVDDSKWYETTKSLLHHEVPSSVIKTLKRQHLPSKRERCRCRDDCSQRAYVGDSEHAPGDHVLDSSDSDSSDSDS